jgi:hypothetical protein
MSSYGRLVDEALEAGFNKVPSKSDYLSNFNNCGGCEKEVHYHRKGDSVTITVDNPPNGFFGGASMNSKPDNPMINDIDVNAEEVKAECKHAKRKGQPVTSGVLNYFPDAIKYVSVVSRVGNEQHQPNTPLHWDKSKSSDELDALVRHLIDHNVNPLDDDGVLHLGKVAWRALAALQRYLDSDDTKSRNL